MAAAQEAAWVWAVDMIGAPAALMLALLAQADQSLRYASGRMVAAMSSAYAGEGKTDAKDAYVIAETVRLRRRPSTQSTLCTVIVTPSCSRPSAASLRGRPVVKGAALFPLDDGEDFRNHRLWKSLASIGIGAVPFLPGNTGLVEEWLDALLTATPSELAEPGPPFIALEHKRALLG